MRGADATGLQPDLDRVDYYTNQLVSASQSLTLPARIRIVAASPVPTHSAIQTLDALHARPGALWAPGSAKQGYARMTHGDLGNG